MFKLNEQGIQAVKTLKNDNSFKVFLANIEDNLKNLDKTNRSLLDPNLLLRESGKANALQSILDSVASV